MEIQEFDYKKDSIIVIVNKILRDAIDYKASDIHFDTKEDGMLIKFRINGDLMLYSKIEESHKKDIITRVKILSGLNITNTSKFQSGNFVYSYNDKNNNLRISCVPVINGEKIVIHISSFENEIPSIDELGFSEDNLVKIKNIINSNSGAVILVGGMGSGKNATFYTILNGLDSEKKNIISIEKNIKIKIDNVNQIKSDKNNVVDLIKDSLLLDPNIILIDEIDSSEMVDTVLKVANSGGFIITTMQGKNGYDVLNLLMNMKIENYLLSSSLTGIVAQRLVKRLCPNCKVKRNTTEYEKQIFNKLLGKNVKEIYEAKGCKDCCNGYDKRIPLAEVITFDDNIKKAIANSKDQKNLRKIVYEKNDSLIVDGLNRVINGETTLEEILNILDSNYYDKDFDIKNLINNYQSNNETNDVKEEEKKEPKEEVNDTKVDEKEVDEKVVKEDKKDNVEKVDNKDKKTETDENKKDDDLKKEDKQEEGKVEDNKKDDDSKNEDKQEEVKESSEEKEDEFVINLSTDDDTEEEQEATNEEDKKEEEKTTDDKHDEETEVKEKVEDKKNDKKKDKKRNIPSFDNLSTSMGAFKDLKKPSYDDFDYDDMNAV